MDVDKSQYYNLLHLGITSFICIMRHPQIAMYGKQIPSSLLKILLDADNIKHTKRSKEMAYPYSTDTTAQKRVKQKHFI